MNTRWFLLIAAVAVVGLAVGLSGQRRPLLGVLPQISDDVDEGNSKEERDTKRAAAVIDQVRKHYFMPEGASATVAEIINIDALLKKNDFYIGAENGDYLILTRDRAILYSTKRDVILNTLPIKTAEKAKP